MQALRRPSSPSVCLPAAADIGVALPILVSWSSFAFFVCTGRYLLLRARGEPIEASASVAPSATPLLPSREDEQSYWQGRFGDEDARAR